MACVGAVAAYFAYQTARSAIDALRVSRASTNTEAFLKATAIVDDETVFGVNYDLVTANASKLRFAGLADNGLSLSGVTEPYDPSLPNAIQDVLSALEKVGIIFYYTTAKEMIDEYVGDVVINAYEALSHVIQVEREADAEMYERFQQMYDFCRPRWRSSPPARVRYTNTKNAAARETGNHQNRGPSST